MRKRLFETKAPKQTVSTTLNSIRAEIREELAALDRYEARHGSFPEFVRAHYERDQAAV